MAVFSSPFDTLLGLQQALDAFRTSNWLDAAGPSGGGAFPPVNVFRKGDDFAIIAEVPGVKKADLDVQVKGRTIRISGTKTVAYPERAGVHRRERQDGRVERAPPPPDPMTAGPVPGQGPPSHTPTLLPPAASEQPRSSQGK